METQEVADTLVKVENLRSYRTYEEWKQNFCVKLNCSILCSYRTYEEWKLSSTLIISNAVAPFLPYL